MGRFARLLLSVALFLACVPLALFGLFAILYSGDSGSGNTYVRLGGRQIDADFAGAIALALAVVAMLAGILLLKGRRFSATAS